MKKILVTGGAGYIGSHTVVELIHSGFKPVIIDNLCNSSIKNIEGIYNITEKNVKWYNADCTNVQSIKDIFKKEKNIEGVIHFAAYKSVDESVRNPKKYFHNNIKSLENILECMMKYNTKNIIFSSSCTVYGKADLLPVNEKTELKKAESPYGETKQICEDIIKESEFNSTILRYFNPVGSHKSIKIGDCSNDKANNLVPILCEFASKKRKKFIIHGKDYNTPDGTCIRDYIHVVDLAKSHVKAFDFLINNSGKHIFNIGRGQGVSVLEIIKEFEKATGIVIDYKIGPRRSGDIDQIYADVHLANTKLKWRAKESIKQAMISSWQWEKLKN